jgi:hypothetical protein
MSVTLASPVIFLGRLDPHGQSPWHTTVRSLDGASLPAHDHVRFDGLARAFQIGAGFFHVQPNGVYFVAGRLGQAITGDDTGIVRPAGQPQDALGNDPRVAGATMLD